VAPPKFYRPQQLAGRFDEFLGAGAEDFARVADAELGQTGVHGGRGRVGLAAVYVETGVADRAVRGDGDVAAVHSRGVGDSGRGGPGMEFGGL